VVAVFYYLRIVVAMYMTEERAGAALPLPRLPGLALVGLTLAVAGVLYLGILPAWAIDAARASIGTIF
jgi:NADH:ubiquinone oxidoreductase subunit 2 (subunit N)